MKFVIRRKLNIFGKWDALSIIAIAFLFALSPVYSQDKKAEKELLQDAESFFDNENYLSALPVYLELEKLNPEEIEYKFKAGICYLVKSDEKEKSIEYLESVLNKKPKTQNLYYFLGKACRLNYRFDDAIAYFEQAKKSSTSGTYKKSIARQKEICENAKILVQTPMAVKIENIGAPINTAGSEYAPVISSDESVLIYTYRGERSIGGLQDQYGNPDVRGDYYEDIFITYKLGSTWMEPEGISENINTPRHDASIGLAADGQKLLIYIDMEKTSGDIFISELDSNLWTVPVRLNENINTDAWEGRGSLSADERTIYFSSKRKGGLGGRDIYKSTIGEDGDWGKAVNIGSVINTPYDDDAPFIHPDGKTLYFSSKGHNSMGGYDIFRTIIQEDGSFSNPVNIGYPINSTDDDVYYVESANGERAYYSSGEAGGYGQQDIYVVNWGAASYALVLLKGEVTANDKPAVAKISVTYVDGLESQGEYRSNSATGNYLINLPAGSEYHLVYQVDGYDPYVENVDARGVNKYMEKIVDVRLYSDDYSSSISISGTMIFNKLPLEPASNIKLLITEDDGSISTFQSTITDKKGFFRFVNLPPDKNYILSLDEHEDADLHATISGIAMLRGEPKEGLLINKVLTKEDGTFVLENINSKSFKYAHLPPDNSSAMLALDLSDPEVYLEVLQQYGNASAEGLVFKVQVAAYFSPENYLSSHLNGLGQLEATLLNDGITRFTLGRFNTLNEALKLKRKAIDKGTLDAFVIIIYKGERKLLSEMVANKFYSPDPDSYRDYRDQ